MDGIWVLTVVPLSQERVLIDRHPGGVECILHGTLYHIVVDAGCVGIGWGMYEVDAPPIHASVQECLHCCVSVNCIPIDNDLP